MDREGVAQYRDLISQYTYTYLTAGKQGVGLVRREGTWVEWNAGEGEGEGIETRFELRSR